jgi:hypothetical protein
VEIFYGRVAGKIDMAFANMATVVLLFVRDGSI